MIDIMDFKKLSLDNFSKIKKLLNLVSEAMKELE